MFLHLKFLLILLVEYSPFNNAALSFRHLILNAKMQELFLFNFYCYSFQVLYKMEE